MSMELMVKAMKTKVGNPVKKLVLIKLADNANDKGECWPSYQHIADHCEVDKRTVMRHVKDLSNKGYVRIIHRKGEKGNSSNIFMLSIPSDPLSLPSDNKSPPSDRVSPPPSDRVSPRTSHSLEPVNEYRGDLIKNGFEHWWRTYPSERRTSKPKCFDKFAAKCKSLGDEEIGSLVNEISVDIKRRIDEVDDIKFMPLTTTYLNNERWNDGK